MAIETSEPPQPHWSYFLAIEDDLIVVSRYVEFHQDNFETYSLELVHLLLAVSSEVDVVAKLLCKKIDASNEPREIPEYRNIIVEKFPNLPNFEAHIAKYDLTLKPWNEWRGQNSSPLWWRAYNKVKHERDANFHLANLKHVLNAFAGLFCLLLYFYGPLSIKPPAPKLLDTKKVDPGYFVNFELPDEVNW